MSKKEKYFENLDGLRFLCFLSVFLFHSFYTEFQYIKTTDIYLFITKNIFGNGNIGVNFFFVLSGFLITYLLIEEKKLNKKINIVNFWIRRMLRIWPLYFMCVFFGFFCFPLIKVAFGQTTNETASIVYYLSFINNFDFIKRGLPDASILGVLWSVAIEEQFYFIWPIILYFLPIKKYWIAFLSVIITSILFRAFNDTFIMHEHHTLSCIGDMAVGAFGAWLISEKKMFLQKFENLRKYQILILYCIFIVIFFFRKELLLHYYGIRIFERLFISLIIISIILEQNYAKNSFFKLGKFKMISKLGKISYGLYCLHFIGILVAINITKIFEINTHLWQIIIIETSLALIITIIISKISYKFYETPFLKLKNKFSYKNNPKL
ncbi:MAG: acyltransferase [Bacteroidales bacterium]|jgi:peptidoglycan/LPS O-acetylase OafA/YrhL|nr:acyltransferase [Bacteroidales bacterium]